ncbi:RNI-like protein [Hymenopellis radicata]|nr:RNI-like protein [Hymenopellis radicata]
MSRANNVRGPTSALTEFLRESGITPTAVALRAANRIPRQDENTTDAAAAETPQEEAEAAEPDPDPSPRRTRRRNTNYDSDELDDPPTPAKKQKVTKAAETKKAAAKGKGRKVKKGKDDDDDDEEDAYTALSRSLWSNQGASSSKPPVGGFANCAKCEKRFTVTKYTMAAIPGPGYLCHPCAKAGGSDPFKKPAVPKKRKPAAERRNVTHFEERLFPSLASLCIEIISRHLNEIDAFGDIGTLNMQSISKAISKNRSLSSENAHLFYGAEHTNLTLTRPDALTTLAYLNPNLTTLRLDFCGLISDAVISAWSNSLPNLVSLQLLGPFLIKPPAWIQFFTSHPKLECFFITQSPRFDLECLDALIDTSGETLQKLGLQEVGQLSDEFLQSIARLAGHLKVLDISDPSTPCSDDALITLLEAVGPTLTSLNISGHHTAEDDVLLSGVQPNVQCLSSLAIRGLGRLSNEGVADFFSGWTSNPPLTSLDMSRIPLLKNEALLALLEHSGSALQELNINGWKDVENEALEQIGVRAPELRTIDLGFCRGVDDFTLKGLIEQNNGVIREIKVWGCNRVAGKWHLSGKKHENLRIYGIESFN